MKTLLNAGVFGLVATPTVSLADPAGGNHQIKGSLLELEGVDAAPCTTTGADFRKGAVRSAAFIVAASMFSCLFIGMALAGAVIARSCNVVHAQVPSKPPPSR